MGKLFSSGVVLTLALATVAPVLQAAPAQAARTTVVALTFDDGVASQSVVPAMLDAHGMKGTFYVNSNTIGHGGWLSWSQLAQFAADGQEIAGHTLDHTDLTVATPVEAQRQVCADRARLMNHGFPVTDFAYPYGNGYDNATVRGIVTGCGYNSARKAYGLYSAAPECVGTGCGYPYASPIPPDDALAVPTADNATTDMSLATLESFVTHAEDNGGGFVPLVFHEFCNGCDQYSTTPEMFNAILDWLQARGANGTIVKTMAEVIGGSVQASPALPDTTAPTSQILCNDTTCASTTYLNPVQVTLSGADNIGGSDIDRVRYTTDGSDPTISSPEWTAPFTVAVTTTVKYRAWDNDGNIEATNSQLIKIADTTPPVTTIACNATACGAGWYTSAVQVSLTGTDNVGGSGVDKVIYTTDGSDPTLVHGTTYAAPFAASTTTTVKFRAWDLSGNAENAVNTQIVKVDTAAPTSAIACDTAACSAANYPAAVQVTLSANDTGVSGLDAVRYTTNGSDPTLASTAYTVPFMVSSNTTVKFRAWDLAGNAEATHTQVIKVDNAAPTSSVTCNGTTCSGGWYTGSVLATLSAVDAGGSGVAAIRYTTDGTSPTATSPLYSAPLSLSSTTTLKFRAWDNNDNAEPVNTQLVQVDETAPTSAATCGGTACASGWHRGAVAVSLSAADTGSSGVEGIHYTIDGSIPTLTSPLYTAPITLSVSNTLKFRAWDIAGNAEGTNALVLQIDGIAPTTKIACGGGACSNGVYRPSVKVTLSATDAGGSGIAAIHYTTNGSTPTATSPLYHGPINFTASRTMKFRAIDKAGNAGVVQVRVIRIGKPQH